jgi:luciferase family oxidoreductase group 1
LVRESLAGTLALAQECERLGYSRYWIAEHHWPDSAHSSPEILVAVIAAATKTIRVGAGAVLLRYYSAMKVCETFTALSNLFPGRIDLGVAWGPGADTETAAALVSGNLWELDRSAFEAKVIELHKLLAPSAHPDARVTSSTAPGPQMWVLGASTESGALAGGLEVPYGRCLFFGGPPAANPAAAARHPPALIAASVVCASTVDEAHMVEESLLRTGHFASNIVGDADTCARQLHALMRNNGVTEALVAMWDADPGRRLASYRLLADAAFA